MGEQILIRIPEGADEQLVGTFALRIEHYAINNRLRLGLFDPNSWSGPRRLAMSENHMHIPIKRDEFIVNFCLDEREGLREAILSHPYFEDTGRSVKTGLGGTREVWRFINGQEE